MHHIIIILLITLLSVLQSTQAQYNLSIGPIDWSSNFIRVTIQFDNYTALPVDYRSEVTFFDTILYGDIIAVVSQPQYNFNVSDILINLDNTDNSTNVLYTYYNIQYHNTLIQSQYVYSTLYSEYNNHTSYLHKNTTLLQYITAINEYCIDSGNNTISCSNTVIQLQYATPNFYYSIYTAAVTVVIVYSYMYLAVYRPNRPRITQEEYTKLWPQIESVDNTIRIAQVHPIDTFVETIDIPAPYIDKAVYMEPAEITPRSLSVHAPITPRKFHIDHNGRVTHMPDNMVNTHQSTVSNTSTENNKLYSHTPSHTHQYNQSISKPIVPRHRIDNSIRSESIDMVPQKLYTAARKNSIVSTTFNTGTHTRDPSHRASMTKYDT